MSSLNRPISEDLKELKINEYQGRSSNITSMELDKDTTNKLRGDAIGDTMYSEKFVLETLMKMQNLNWCEELENDLCFLWDMTIEKVVCDYLITNFYPSLVSNALAKHNNNNRLIEILIGIFANILCNNSGIQLKPDEIQVVLNEIGSDDPLILIQIMRFIQAVSLQFDQLSFFNQQIYNQFNFILTNSMNHDLLLETLKTLAKIMDYPKLDGTILTGDLLQSVVISYQTITGDDNSEPNFLAMKSLVQIASGICLYIDHLKVARLSDEIKPHLDLFTNEIRKLLDYYSNEENLMPVSNELDFYMESFLFIFQIFPVNYSSEILITICKIVLILNKNECDTIDNFVQLIIWFLLLNQPEKVQSDLYNLFDDDDIKILLKIVKNQAVKCNSNYSSQLEYILMRL